MGSPQTPDRLSIERCRKLANPSNGCLSEEAMHRLRDDLYDFAQLLIDTEDEVGGQALMSAAWQQLVADLNPSDEEIEKYFLEKLGVAINLADCADDDGSCGTEHPQEFTNG